MGRRFESLAAFRQVFANRNLRRIQLAMTGSTLGHWGYTVALVVWAYDAGGPTLVGLATFVRILPAALAAPFLGALADKHPRRTVMVISDLVRAASLAVAGVAIAIDLPASVVLAAVAVAGIAASTFYPSLSALMPSLTKTPEELTAANVTTSAIDGIGMFVGPAIGGVLLVATSPQTVFFWTVACLLWSAALVSGVRRVEAAAAEEEDEEPRTRERILVQVREGFAATLRDPTARLIVGLYSLQTLIAGFLAAIIVLVVFELLHRDAAWVGYLEGAIGVGGLLGVLASTSLVGRRDLAAAFGIGVVLFGAPLILVAGWSTVGVALIAMAIIGVGNSLCDVAGVTLLQRATPDAVRARVFSVLETAVLASLALGGLVAPLLAEAAGLRTALVVGGALPVVAVLAVWRPLGRLDLAPPPAALGLLRRVPLFAPLSGPVLERLAIDAHELRVPAGEEVCTQGAPGSRFYVIADGEVEISIDGAPVRRESVGESFGEIALLRDSPRTATVTATKPTTLIAIDREPFLSAVTGHPGSSLTAEGIVAARLAHARPAFATI